METLTSQERPRKRRAINACINCRTSKVRCDGKRPCQRCEGNNTVCQYHEVARDDNVLRLEKLEAEVAALRYHINHLSSIQVVAPTEQTTTPTSLNHFGERSVPSNVINTGLITWEQAASWFQSFFSGSQYLVPIFCERHDTMVSVSSRSAFLFDAIIGVGCRAEEGFGSSTHRQLQSRLRNHLTNLLIKASVPSMEDIQAITLMAAYSENGFVMIALALRFAVQLGLPNAVDELIARGPSRSRSVDADEKELYRLSRLWYGVCNLQLFFSLDGGKMPCMSLHVSSRKLRSLISHQERTPVDVRLLSQVELNIIRSEAYSKLTRNCGEPLPTQDENRLRAVLDDTSVELTLWLDQWTTIVSTEQTPDQHAVALQNLHIQRQWALMTLHLKAIATTGIENIAIMTDFQQDSVRKAKEAAACHLHYILEASMSPCPPPSHADQAQRSPYLTTFKWTLDYVWAKCAFSVLLVLKLAILLRDPVPSIILLLRDAHRLLEELKRVTVEYVAYFQILQTSIEKCEAALREYVAQQNTASESDPTSPEAVRAAEDEFQGYVPNEFVFEWEFPGLNLKNMPLGWQDFSTDFDGLF